MRIFENLNEFHGILTFDRAHTRLLHFKSRSREKSVFSPHVALSWQRAVNTLYPIIPHRREGMRGGSRKGTEKGDARRGFARTFRHVLERLRVPGLNKPLHFLAFQRRRRFSLPQVSRRVVGKDSNPLSPLSSPPRSPRVRRAAPPISSSSVFAFHPVAPCKQPRLPMTRSYQLEIGRFRWRGAR